MQKKWHFSSSGNPELGGRRFFGQAKIISDFWAVFFRSQEHGGNEKYAYTTGFNADFNAFFQFSRSKWAGIFCQFFRFLECKS